MNKFKILVLPRYGKLGASSRLRMFQYFTFLNEMNCEIFTQSFIDDDALLNRYNRGHYTIKDILHFYFSRIKVLLKCMDYDLVWIEKEALPWMPLWIEMLLLRKSKYILDYDDAVFHQYDQHKMKLIKLIYASKINKLINRSAGVVVGNSYLESYAKKTNVKKIFVIPTVVDLTRYPSQIEKKLKNNYPLKIVWIGTPGTVHYLKQITIPLQTLSKNYDFELNVIGATIFIPFVKIKCIEWTQVTEVKDISACDIGIMPLPDGLWERGKCGYKLIQYMACGLPVVASLVGANVDIVSNGHNGYLAKNDEDWINMIGNLLSSSVLRNDFGASGRLIVESSFSLASAEMKLADALNIVKNNLQNGDR